MLYYSQNEFFLQKNQENLHKINIHMLTMAD